MSEIVIETNDEVLSVVNNGGYVYINLAGWYFEEDVAVNIELNKHEQRKLLNFLKESLGEV